MAVEGRERRPLSLVCRAASCGCKGWCFGVRGLDIFDRWQDIGVVADLAGGLWAGNGQARDLFLFVERHDGACDDAMGPPKYVEVKIVSFEYVRLRYLSGNGRGMVEILVREAKCYETLAKVPNWRLDQQ